MTEGFLSRPKCFFSAGGRKDLTLFYRLLEQLLENLGGVGELLLPIGSMICIFITYKLTFDGKLVGT